MQDRFVCVNIAVASTQVTGLGGAAALDVGTGAGTVAAGNDSRITGALQGAGTAAGDLGGTWANPTVTRIRDVAVSATAPGPNQVLKYSSVTSSWEPATDSNSGGTVTAITPSTGLTATNLSGGAITTTSTLSVDVGTGPQKIVQLDGAGRLPAVDGSQLTNMPMIPFENVEVFDATGSWPTNGARRVFIQVWGGGGGGGGAGLVSGAAGGAGGRGRVVIWY